MSFFHDNTPMAPAQVAPDHTFYSGNPTEVDELFSEMQEPKQVFEAPKPNVTDLEAPEEPEANSDPDKPKSDADLRRAARTPAKFVVGVLDGGLGYLSAMLAKSDESDSYKASKDEREQLTDLWAEYLKGKGADLPPSVMILIMTVVVYGPKLKMAWDDRKQNEVMREQRERLIQQDMEIRVLRAQVEQKTLSEKLNTDKK